MKRLTDTARRANRDQGDDDAGNNADQDELKRQKLQQLTASASKRVVFSLQSNRVQGKCGLRMNSPVMKNPETADEDAVSCKQLTVDSQSNQQQKFLSTICSFLFLSSSDEHLHGQNSVFH
jgi:hypothetical protein